MPSWLYDHGWILMVFMAQLAWASGNYLDRYLLSRYQSHDENGAISGTGTLLLVSASFAGLIALSIFTVSQFFETDVVGMPIDVIVQAMLVGVLEIAWLIPYFYALEKSDESEVAPVFQSVPIFGLLFGLVFFAEIPLPHHIAGSGIIIIGALILNYDQVQKRINGTVLGLVLLASSIIAIAAFLFKDAALEENYWGTAFWMCVGMVTAGLVLVTTIKPYRNQFAAFLIRKDWRGVALNGVNEVFDQVAIMAFYAAVMLGPSVMTVQATTAFHPMIVFLIGLAMMWGGSRFHQERYRDSFGKKLAGSAVIVAGSILIFS